MPFDSKPAMPGKALANAAGAQKPDPLIQPALANAMRFGAALAKMAPQAQAPKGKKDPQRAY